MLTIDLDTRTPVEWPGGSRVRQVEIKRCAGQTLYPVQFVQCGQVVAVGNGNETGQLVAKQLDAFASNFVFSSSTWNRTGSPPVYRFVLNLNEAPVQAALGVGSACPLQAVTLMAELEWTDGAGNTYNTLPFLVVLLNSVINGDEAAGSTPSIDMVSWPQINRLAGGTLTDLDCQPTLGVIPFGAMIALAAVADPGAEGALVNAGGLTVWQFQNRTDATGPGLQRPLDFDAEANPGVWTKIQ